jgi:hypothetical protein
VGHPLPVGTRRARAALRRTHEVRLAPGTHLMGAAAGYPSEGWVVWTFLISLGENGVFSILLVPAAHPSHLDPHVAEVLGEREPAPPPAASSWCR